MAESDQIKRLKLVARRVTEIPTLPAVMTKVIEMIDDPSTTASQLARFISYDQAFTVKLLKLANSAFYGLSRKVGTVDMALLVLGFDEVKNLGLTIAVIDTFRDAAYYSFFDMNDFWVHSIAVAAGCKVLVKETGQSVPPGDLFVAGLLHDIGTLVMCRYLTQDFSRVIETLRKDGARQHEAEMSVIGFTHADVGGWLTKTWNFPVHQVGAIANHHTPRASFLKPNLALNVCFANELAWRAGWTSGVGDRPAGEDPTLFAELNPPRDASGDVDWEFFQERLRAEMANAEQYLAVLRQGA